MEITRVLIMFDSLKYTKSDILADLKSENFAHAFKFMCDLQNDSKRSGYIREANEVWVFGNVEHEEGYNEVFSEGKDIWVMA